MHLAVMGPLLGGLSLLTLALAAVLLASLAVPPARAALARFVAGEERAFLGIAWVVAATATAGSLYLSEVVGFQPCLLCWYQRIAMYPLVLVLGVATLTADRAAWRYVVPLAGVGALISSYHVLIQLMPTLDVVTCSLEAPCTVRYLAVFGFVSIPFMAGAGFLGVAALVLVARAAGRAVTRDG